MQFLILVGVMVGLCAGFYAKARTKQALVVRDPMEEDGLEWKKVLVTGSSSERAFLLARGGAAIALLKSGPTNSGTTPNTEKVEVDMSMARPAGGDLSLFADDDITDDENAPELREYHDYVPFYLMLGASALILLGPTRNLLFYMATARFSAADGVLDATTSHILDFCLCPMMRSSMLQLYTLLAYVLMFLSTARFTGYDETLLEGASSWWLSQKGDTVAKKNKNKPSTDAVHQTVVTNYGALAHSADPANTNYPTAKSRCAGAS